MFHLSRKKSSAPPNASRIYAIGAELLERSHHHEKGLLSAKFYSDKLLDWAMKDEGFKTQLFRLVDVFPVLRTNEAVYSHIEEYLLAPGVHPPPGFGVGMKLGSLAKGAVTSAMASQIRSMAGQFIAGRDAATAIPVLKKLWDSGVGFSVDLLGEACVSASEADAYTQRYVELLRVLGEAASGWETNPKLDRGAFGAIPRVNISLKLSALTPRFLPIDPAGTIADLRPRVERILGVAKEIGAFVNVDMESGSYKELTLEAFEQLFASNSGVDVGIVLQAYLTSGEADARALAEWCREHGRTITVRLVKGAYWDYETIHAELLGWPSPVYSHKEETDANFERMARILLDAAPTPGKSGIKLALGSHNARSIASAMAAAEERGLDASAVELQMLYGMAEPIKLAAVEMGYRVRNYVPIGEVIPGMAYLVRRLLENTSNESWLRQGLIEKAETEKLLADPVAPSETTKDEPAIRHALSAAHQSVGDGLPFQNEPPRDFSKRKIRERFAAEIDRAKVPPVTIETDAALVDPAVARAKLAFNPWRARPIRDRAALLIRTAKLMRERRDSLAATICIEAGKPWAEADADICEAIDFCEYYARESIHLFEPKRLGQFVGELNETFYEPRGVAVVISPWNFPLAICCGMTVAALVTGNPTIVKPAEQTPGIAKRFVELLHEAGIPHDVVQLLPGQGETIGAALVRHPDVALIAFTGSREVGFEIIRLAGDTQKAQAGVKKVIAEMGGKNAIIVDSSADSDEAVLGVRQSAFGYAGQKCSAGSRAIVVDDGAGSYEAFVDRLVAATSALVIGEPRNPATQVGPVIDESAANKIRSMIDQGKQEARCVLSMPVPPHLDSSIFVSPTLFSDAPPDGFLAREEIFGPVLAVYRATSFEHAIELANASPYKLTGGVFSRTPSHLEKAKREFRVGNLYLNRNITGALVGRQPFGGFGHSGVGSKAGGADYLLQFVEPRVITENTMRRGFAPGKDSPRA